MKLLRTEITYGDKIRCDYVCSKCGQEFRGEYVLPNFCPNCGRELDKAGKPGTIEDCYSAAAALAYAAISAGVLLRPLPKVEKSGGGYDVSYTCRGDREEGAK